MQLASTILSALLAAQAASASDWYITFFPRVKSDSTCAFPPTGFYSSYEGDDNDSACINGDGLTEIADCLQYAADGASGECTYPQADYLTVYTDSSCLVYFQPDCKGGYLKSDYEDTCFAGDGKNQTIASFRCDSSNVHA